MLNKKFKSFTLLPKLSRGKVLILQEDLEKEDLVKYT